MKEVRDMKTIHELYKYALAVLLALAGGVNVWGQEIPNGQYVIQLDAGSVWEQFGNWAQVPEVHDWNEDSYWECAKSNGNNLNSRNRLAFSFPYYNTPAVIDYIEIIAKGPINTRPARVVIKERRSGSDNEDWTTVDTYELDRDKERNIIDFSNNKIDDTHQHLLITFFPARTYNDGSKLQIHEIRFYTDQKRDYFVQGNQYENRYEDYTIRHKYPKWYDLREGISSATLDMDSFDDEGENSRWFLPEDNPLISNYPVGRIQAAHTYIDTIYMHKGELVTLTLPDRLNDASVRGYQRWYNFRTDGTFETTQYNTDKVYDLLTPASNQRTAYRFKNGYIGKPMTASYDNANGVISMNFYCPTDKQSENWFSETYDNDWFIVACDVSGYNDYTNEYTNDSHNQNFLQGKGNERYAYEPTLTHRVLFYIATVDDRSGDNWENGYGRLTKSEYQGGSTDGKYLEEYDISFPETRLSQTNIGSTDSPSPELIALSKDARGFAIPGVGMDKDHSTLKATLIDQGSGIKLLSNVGTADDRNYSASTTNTVTITGESRIVLFQYPNTRNGIQTVDMPVGSESSKATILITKEMNGTTYNLARYNLTFVKDGGLLTQSQLKEIENETASDGDYWKDYGYRTESFMNENNYELLTSLDWDYDPDMAKEYGQKNYYYPFPMDWNYSSYSFFDGSDGNNFVKVSYDTPSPEWGYYAIMNNFVENVSWGSDHDGKLLDGSTYHLYIDASDRPGVIAQLPFEETLCPGSELFITAWVKSAGYGSASPDAGMLFTIIGENRKDGSKQGQEVLYRYSPGQIRRTDYLSSQIPGCGGNSNEWLQVYFSFLAPEVEYERYILQIDNNSESTRGGDMYLDDVRVYLATPDAKVSQLEASCSTENTRMNIQLDWDRLLSRTGGAEGSDSEAAIDFCFIDQLKYNQYVKEHPNDIEGALKASVEWIGDGTEYKEQFATLHYYLDYDKNRDYGDPNLPQDGPLAKNNKNGSKYYAYHYTNSGVENLAVDFYAQLSPNRLYWILINTTDGTNKPTAADFVDFQDVCAIKTEFRVTALNLVKVNGEVLRPENNFCAGQIFDFSVDLRVPFVNDQGDAEDYIVIDDGVYFDWFFGTTTDYFEPNTTYNVSIADALSNFRELYPEATAVDESTPTKTETIDGVEVEFSQAMYNLLKEYSEKEGVGPHSPLMLHRSSLDITLLKSGLDLIIQPIRTTVPPASLEGISEEQWALICWDPIILNLEATGEAPEAHPGINMIEYPSKDFNPNVRIGLGQIEEVSNKNRDKKSLKIELQEIKLVTEGANYIGTLDDEKERYLYLSDTDDPEMKDFISSTVDPDDPVGLPSFTKYDLPIGWITDLHGEEYSTSSQYDDYMDICFDLTGELAKTLYNEDKDNPNYNFVFNPREGYTYTFLAHFVEKFNDSHQQSNACWGQLMVTMKVVPEYLVWDDQQKTQDGIIGNWNNDGNWKRADKERLLKGADNEYLTNAENTTDNGFVPMLFSKVIIPRNGRIHLYTGGFVERMWDDNVPAKVADPTENIQYDLMAYKHITDGNNISAGEYATERYRVALCDQIHFEPGAEMLHAEYLLYNKAWVDYELDDARWYTLASPLQGVVAGDFYAPTSGRQATEYFQPINFDTDKGYNRFNPSIYQRGWKNSTTKVKLYTEGSDYENVAIAGNWSSLYNDVEEKYDPGTGFSLKVQDLAEPANGKALFRLPKADGSYSYYEKGSSTGNNPTEVNRTNAGRLKSDDICHRTETDIDYTGSIDHNQITVELSESANEKYYLVGNPFMAHLNMKTFLENENNKDVLEPKYWYVADDGVQNVVVTDPDDGNTTWTNADENSLIPPLRSFFVKKKKDANGSTIIFTHDMQALGGTSADAGTTSGQVLLITATNTDGKVSRAAIAYDATAKATYETSEDAELFLDSNLSDVPAIYTVAGTMATSINRTSELYNIPVGIYGNSTEMVTLSFDGLKNFSSATLYDAEKRTETPLREGTTITLPANTSGRYFLRAGAPTANESIATDAIQIYTLSGNRVMVTSTAPLKDIRVYTISGALVKQAKSGFCSHELYLSDGIYIITAKNAIGTTETTKIKVN